MDRLIVAWATTEPGRLADRLITLGFALSGRDRLVFPAAEIRLIQAEPNHEPDRLLDPRWEPAAPERASYPTHPNAVSDVAALGWATVDADRTSAAALVDPGSSFMAMPDDLQLGARVRGSLTRRPATLLLEPATEGRLAAALARAGEGPAALYLVAGEGGLARLAAAAQAVGGGSAVRPGPLGPALLLPGGPAWGPHLVVVAAHASELEAGTPGTIRP
jgi:hypothetical protein